MGTTAGQFSLSLLSFFFSLLFSFFFLLICHNIPFLAGNPL